MDPNLSKRGAQSLSRFAERRRDRSLWSLLRLVRSARRSARPAPRNSVDTLCSLSLNVSVLDAKYQY